jgi:beta-glucosidase/6-phospho-beta-glucosidase/beta-galactosidase
MSEFLWGVSTSGYQSEGGYNGDGQPRNNWAEAEREGRVHRTGRAAEFWERYEEDFARARGMGCAAFRLGIEWPRVQPSCAPGRLDEPPPFDEVALDAYADRIAACRKAGLEPVVTLQHFTHPEWLGADAWLDDATVGRFAVYVARTVERVNCRLVEAHGLAAVNRLLAAHIRAYNAIHDLYAARGWAAPMVTTNTFCSDLYWSDQLLMDVLSMRERGQTDIAAVFRAGVAGLNRAVRRAGLPFQRGVFVWLGRLLHRVVDWMAPRFYFTPEAFEFVLAELEKSPRARVFDYVGLDYYDPFAGHMFRPPSFADLEFPTRSLRAWLMDGMTSKWWDWRLLPEGLHFFCERAARLYGRPVLIAENGMALRRRPDNSGLSHRRDKQTRSDFLRRHVAEVVRLRKGGCPLIGYLHWSLTDNYEWGSYTPRFGLFTLDYTRDAERRVEDHLGDRPSETYARLIAAAEKELGEG